MTGQSPQPATVAMPISSDAAAGVSPNLFQHRRLWLRLAAYRPLLVVGGFWMVLLVIAIVAYGRLTASGEQQRSQPRAPYPHEQAQLEEGAVAGSGEVLPTETNNVSPTEPITAESEPDATPSHQTVPGWSLSLLVVLCAGGCFTLSKQLSATRRPAPRKRRGRPAAAALGTSQGGATAPSAPPNRRQKAAPKRMQPYQPAAGASGFTPAPPRAVIQETSTASASTVPVSVVSEGSANSLDWPKDSLVNTMDVRQRHSVSSWLSS